MALATACISLKLKLMPLFFDVLAGMGSRMVDIVDTFGLDDLFVRNR